MSELRVGKISSINYEAGKARVVYTDKDRSVTKEIPFLSFEYHMPPIGSQVFVIHLSNGSEMGIVLGSTWSNKNVPYEGKKGLYRKELSNTKNEAVIRYDDEEKEFLVKIPKCTIDSHEIVFSTDAGQITVEDLINMKNILGV